MVCEVYLDARNENVLLPNQRGAAKAAEVLIRGLARVGIVALVDEATGYHEVRARQELQKILEAYVQAEFRPWVRRSRTIFSAKYTGCKAGNFARGRLSGRLWWAS